ncbi:MAG: DAK2 domain-containing protein [Anaerolineales bacterium]|nr:MAG: DAK2 domain-containing protein [Anaerolineales bacterium]
MTKKKSPKAKSKTRSSASGKTKSTKAKSRRAASSKKGKKGKVDLAALFENALGLITANRQQVNELDGYNGNHGDNMVQNVQLIVDALKGRGSKSPSKALQRASETLQAEGKGGTSQYYARGLEQAADQFQGKRGLNLADVVPLIQMVLGAIPAEGHPSKVQSGGSVLDLVAGLGQAPAPEAVKDDKFDLGDLVSTLLPAGLSYLQAKQSGADTTAAAGQALIGTLLGGQSSPLQASTPRSAAGGLIAQALLRAVTGGK